jgi:hypothetical protein
LYGSKNVRKYRHDTVVLITVIYTPSALCPETLEVEGENKKITVENPAYAAWIARDQQVLRFLLN